MERDNKAGILIDIIAGARPNFMKISPIIKAIKKKNESCPGLKYRLIHTGQHYDASMSGQFFQQLGIPDPDLNLAVGSGTQAFQTGQIMVKYEEVIASNSSNLCLVVGDVNSTMACAIVAKKAGIPVAHVEAGIRSWDWSMPEEVNRVVTDSISDYYFVTSLQACENLKSSGVNEKSIFFVGNTMIDSLIQNYQNISLPTWYLESNIKNKKHVLLTLHRPSNVDNGEKLIEKINYICSLCDEFDAKVIFPVHPRTQKSLGENFSPPSNLVIVPPQGYHEFIALVNSSSLVITDSGGITEEATYLKVPCITMRDNTERPETVEIGSNILVGSNPSQELLRPFVSDALLGKWKKSSVPELWDGKSAERIVDTIESIFELNSGD